MGDVREGGREGGREGISSGNAVGVEGHKQGGPPRRRPSCCQGGSPVKEDGIGRRRERRIEGERDRSAVGVMWKEINLRRSSCQRRFFFCESMLFFLRIQDTCLRIHDFFCESRIFALRIHDYFLAVFIFGESRIFVCESMILFCESSILFVNPRFFFANPRFLPNDH